MQTISIANCCFEKELENPIDFKQLISSSSLFRQLQFLPFIYAESDHLVYCIDQPDPSYLQHLQSHFSKVPKAYVSQNLNAAKIIDPWGKSPGIAKLAKELDVSFNTLSLEVLRKINSKDFSFALGKPLNGSAVIKTIAEAKSWILSQKEPFVLKACLGLSGSGHFLANHENAKLEKALLFCEKEFAKGLPIIAEPWVKRTLDFSTQWYINENFEIKYLGATICLNSAKGIYTGSLAGKEEDLFKDHLQHFESHKHYAIKSLKKLIENNYTGNIGLDAFLYEQDGLLRLNPIVEINVRKTMGYVALKLYEKLKPQKFLKLFMSDCSKENKNFLLPKEIAINGQNTLRYKKNLFYELL